MSHPDTASSQPSLMIGTAQFGQRYGLANQSGAPSDQTIRQIIQLALDQGMAAFDTAAAYGESEARLGQAFAQLGVADRVEVVTKIPALPETIFEEPVAAARTIEDSVQQSMRHLGMKVLPTVLFHEERTADRYGYVLESLRERGWVKRIGVSCNHDPQLACDFAAMPGVQVLQLPVNLLDRRHLAGKSCLAAQRYGVSVHVRSVFLQGLLLMPDADVPEHLAEAKPWRDKLRRISKQAGIDMAQVAVRWTLGLPAVQRVIVGVETVEQAKHNLELAARGPLPPDMQQALDQIRPDLPERVVTPWMWSVR